MKVTLDDVKNNEEVEQFIQAAQHQIDVLGYTEHAHRHLNIVSQRAGEILEKLRIWWRKSKINSDCWISSWYRQCN